MPVQPELVSLAMITVPIWRDGYIRVSL